FGRVVDDEVDAGHRLEGPDVASLAADDPALHLVAGQVQHRYDRFAGLLARHALDGEGHDPPGPGLTVAPGLVLGLPDDERGLPLGLVVDARHQLRLGLVGGEPGRPLKYLPALVLEPGQLVPLAVQLPSGLLPGGGT